jgi:hypothetical protein
MGAIAAAAAARNARQIVGVVHRAERIAVRGDLMHEAIDDIHIRERRLRERDRARCDKPFHYGRVTLGDVSTERGIPTRRRRARDGNLILHREWQSGCRPELRAACTHAIDRPRRLEHASGVDRVGDVEILVCVVLLQQLRDVRFGRDVAVPDPRDNVLRTEGEEVIVRLMRRGRDSKRRDRCGCAGCEV